MLKNIGRKVRFTRAADIKRTKHQCGHNKQTIECEDFWPNRWPQAIIVAVILYKKTRHCMTVNGISLKTSARTEKTTKTKIQFPVSLTLRITRPSIKASLLYTLN